MPDDVAGRLDAALHAEPPLRTPSTAAPVNGSASRRASATVSSGRRPRRRSPPGSAQQWWWCSASPVPGHPGAGPGRFLVDECGRCRPRRGGTAGRGPVDDHRSVRCSCLHRRDPGGSGPSPAPRERRGRRGRSGRWRGCTRRRWPGHHVLPTRGGRHVGAERTGRARTPGRMCPGADPASRRDAPCRRPTTAGRRPSSCSPTRTTPRPSTFASSGRGARPTTTT